MPSPSPWRLAAAGLALILLAGCGDNSDTPPAATTTSAATTTTGALPNTTAAPSATTVAPTTTASNEQLIEVTYAGGTVTGGGRKQVKKGQQVTLRVTSDVADEVHLHGYNKKIDLVAGKPGDLTFTADSAGVFEVELEKKGVKLLELEIK
jgi:hypothetical protein